MKKGDINYLVGDDIIKVQPLEPYSDIVCDFMNDFSKKLRLDQRTAAYPDVMSLSFWCRKANIVRLKEEFNSKRLRVGRGLAFHITPSNVPVNFAYSYFFGLLSGNCNIVRVPSKGFEQITIICDIIKEVIELDKYKIIGEMTAFMSYSRDDEITAYFSSKCDARIIWGGDDTIQHIRQYPIKERTIEIVFADRYSFSIINSSDMLERSSNDINNITDRFYNDTYLMDQNACSTPHLIFWYGDSDDVIEQAKTRFWNAVNKVSQKYDLTPIKAIDKYTLLCHLCMDSAERIKVQCYSNYLYTIDMQSLPEDISELRGKFGLFYQYNISDLSDMLPYINTKMQTLTYLGMDKEELASLIVENHIMGIDRIVPMGSSLDIDVYWDGYDIISTLSRCIVYK